MPSSRLEELRALDRQGRLSAAASFVGSRNESTSDPHPAAAPSTEHTSTRSRHNYGYDILDPPTDPSKPVPRKPSETASRLEKLRRLDKAGKLALAADGGPIDTPPKPQPDERVRDLNDSDSSPLKPLGSAAAGSWLERDRSPSPPSPLIQLRTQQPREMRPATLVQRAEESNREGIETLRGALSHPKPPSLNRPAMVQQIFDQLGEQENSKANRTSNSPPRSRSRSPQSPVESAKVVAKVFDKLDSNADGVISRHEWDLAYEPQRVFERLDRNGDGVLQKDEWIAAHAPVAPEPHQPYREMPPPVGSAAFKAHNAAMQHQSELLAAKAFEAGSRSAQLPPPLEKRGSSGAAANQKLDDIASRMKTIEERLRRRQERASEEKDKVEQVEADLAHLTNLQSRNRSRAQGFKERAVVLESNCGKLESEFAEIMSKASQLRAAMR